MATWVKCSTPSATQHVNFDLVVCVTQDLQGSGSVLTLSTGGELKASEPPEELIRMAEGRYR